MNSEQNCGIDMGTEITHNTEDFEQKAIHVSKVSIIANLLLSLIKFIAGIVAHSSAMVSDAIHSASDVISSFIVIIGIKMSSKESDKDHPYGHERLECVAAIALATILLITGLWIGYEAINTIANDDIQSMTTPGALALIAAAVSIIAKEAMYWYTRHYALKIGSNALMADAWHHRSDSLSSIGALIGIVGARMGYPILDPVASFVICFFIIKAAIEIFSDALNKMVDKSCDEETEQNFIKCAESIDGVIRIDLIRTRIFGNKIYIDIEICVDGTISLKEAHDIAENVHDTIESEYKNVKHIMVHVNPYE